MEIIMNERYELEYVLNDYIKNGTNNYVAEDKALSPELAGLQIYDAPLVGIASADDPLFEDLKKEEALGPHVLLPRQWMEEAETVISFFLPYTEAIKKANAQDMEQPAPEWLHGRFEGQTFLMEACGFLKQFLETKGAKVLIPAEDERFWSVDMPEESAGPRSRGFTSCWSERHVAFICGLGTFGLSKGLITKKGVAGRFASLIADQSFEPVKREYTGLYEYCTRCGACIRRCPASAISFDRGKEHELCCKFLDFTEQTYTPRYGCGKCQTGVPCESKIPPSKTGRSGIN